MERIIFLAAVILGAVNLAVSVQVVGYLPNGALIPFDVSISEDFATAVSGEPSPRQPFFRPSINLYDFNKKLEARKIINDGICQVREFNASKDQFINMLEDTKKSMSGLTNHVREDWNKRGEKVSQEDSLRVLGPLISSFCSHYTTYIISGGRSSAHSHDPLRRKRQVTYGGQSNRDNSRGWNWWRTGSLFNRGNNSNWNWWGGSLFNRRNDTDTDRGNDTDWTGPTGWYSHETVDRDREGRPTGFGSGTVGYRNNNFHGRVTAGNSQDRGEFVGANLDFRGNGFRGRGRAGFSERGDWRRRGGSRGNIGVMTSEGGNDRSSASAGFSFEIDW